MKLSQCKIGEIVESEVGYIAVIGHITGLTKDHRGEVIPLVLLAGEALPRPIHYYNLSLYEE